MAVKINELVVQIKVSETNTSNKQLAEPTDTSSSLLCPTEQQKSALAKDLLNLLEDQQAR
ncbi:MULTISPECIES: hypothetical protein [unclassified Candidatus Cardinium]|uniref:hypothetical protein n=1 Tax=unclassified Candidatus Cardinium TaxID=2641185 RepID=UPI001FB2D84A|nr:MULTISPECIES: hypothetical protein [unclassified Candidatus Cardinium]